MSLDESVDVTSGGPSARLPFNNMRKKYFALALNVR